MPSAELIKDILGPKHFNCFSYIVILSRCSILGILMGISVKMFIDDAEKNPKNFRCQSIRSNQKNVILEECFNEYLTSSPGHFPFLAFPILELLFIGMVGPIYSFSVKERVKSLENEDVELQRFIMGTASGQYIFVAYIGQLLVRILFEIIFLVLHVKIPTYFSPLFPCHLNNSYNTEHSMNATNHLSQSATRPVYQCFNSGAEKSASFTCVLCIFNGIFAVLAFIEIMCISIKALRNKNFIIDENFFQTYLKNACCKQERSLLEEYILTMKRNILEYTKHYKPIIANIPDRLGQIKQLDIDSTYTDLIIYLGTIKHDFSGKREEKLNEYPKVCGNYVRIITLEEIFAPNKDTKPNEYPLNIWIVGRPGIGKSFLCLKLLRNWVENGMLINSVNEADSKEFRFIYFYKFRNFNRDENLNLQQLLRKCQFSESLPNEVYSWILRHPEKVLLIFDGLDEFRSKANIVNEDEFENSCAEMMPFSSLYGKLISGKLLKGATVVTTLRSTALSCVENIQCKASKSRTTEISGFSKDKIKEYVDKFFSQEENAKQEVWNHISMNANLLSLCYIPVNCHIVCCSLQARLNSKEEDHFEGLPSTLTEMYEDAVRLIVFKHNPERRNKISTNEEIEAALEKVCELALKGIEEGRLIFQSHEVDNLGQDDTNLLHQLPDEMNHLEPEPQYCFLHLTIQEFLAAKKIVSTTRAHDWQWLKEWVSNHIQVGEWQLVVQFVAGLLRHEEDSDIEIFTDLVPCSTFEEDGEIWWPRWEGKKLVVILFKCLFEISKELKEDWIKEFVEKIGDINIDMSFCGLNDADVTAVAKVLQHFKTSVHSLGVAYNHVGSLGCLMICKFLLGSNMSKMQIVGDKDLNQCQISTLDIRNNELGADRLKHLSAALSTNECKLTTLDIGGNEIGADGLKHLSDALSTNECKLTTLNIGGIEIGDDGLKHLSAALSKNECKLTTLDVGGNGIGDDGLKHLSAALSKNECKLTTLDIGGNGIGADGLKHLSAALSKNECKLTMLNIDENEIGADGLKHLSAALSTNECKLTTLDIAGNEIGADGLKHLSAALSANKCKLTMLDIGGNEIGDDGLKHLSDALSTSECKLTTLNIGGNEIGADGLKHFSAALSKNECKLTTLDIGCIEIGDDGLKHLSAALSTNECKLTTLIISWAKIGDNGLKHLSAALSTNECKLTTLKIGGNEIGDDGLKDLSDSLSKNECKLTTLDIGGNEIGDDGLKHFSDSLSKNECKLTTLDIGGNEIGDDGLKDLSAALSKNECKLTTLNIGGNEIGADGLKHLSAALSKNECKLTTLDIGGNEIGDDGLKHLSDALSTNECKLTTLNIGGNGIGADGLKHLSDALSKNECKLTMLDIGGNEIGDDGLKHLSAALSKNECRLTTLDIAGNEISDNGLKHLKLIVHNKPNFQLVC